MLTSGVLYNNTPKQHYSACNFYPLYNIIELVTNLCSACRMCSNQTFLYPDKEKNDYLYCFACSRSACILQFNVTCDWPTTVVTTTHTVCVVVTSSVVYWTELANQKKSIKKALNEVLFWYQYHFKGTGISIVIFLNDAQP